MLPSVLKEVCVHIRWMIRRDMPEVLDIENRSFEFSWTEEDFIRCLRQRNCIGMVAEHDDRVGDVRTPSTYLIYSISYIVCQRSFHSCGSAGILVSCFPLAGLGSDRY